MNSKLLITNNYYFVSKEIEEETKNLTYPELSFFKPNQEENIYSILSRIDTMPFVDDHMVIAIDISKYKKADLKLLAQKIKESQVNTIICIYYVKDKYDKGNDVQKIFKENNIPCKKSISITDKDISELMNEFKLSLPKEPFLDEDSLDVARNDLWKISMLDNTADYIKYVSRSMNKNVFDLTEALMSRNINKTLMLLQDILETESPVMVNIVLLKHFNSLRNIKSLNEHGLNIREELYAREKLATGKGSYIHPYRLKILTNQALSSGIDFNKAVDILLKNELKKGSLNLQALEISLVKIIGGK